MATLILSLVLVSCYPVCVPKLLANKKLPITRFWIPHNEESTDSALQTISLAGGILPDPDENYGRVLNTSLKTLEEIEKKRCFALLGQPGLGKTITVEQWVDDLRNRATEDDHILLLRGRGIADPAEIWRLTVDSDLWREARRRGGDITLIIDGLDEALQRLPVILHTLRQCLESKPLERTRLVLVSRDRDWRDGRAEELFGLWSENERGGAFELCPLRRKDIEFVVSESGLSSDHFTRVLLERRIGWMAGRPKLLLMLIEEFRAHRRLPDSRGKLFARAALRMCTEHDPERHEILERSHHPVVSAKRVYAVTARIAALLILGGKSYVATSAEMDVASTDLAIESLIGGDEPIEDTSFSVDKTEVLAALDSSHFVAGAPGRLGFDHQAMAEFMAAEYLSRCTTPQLRSLLTQRMDGIDYLLPQFREISAWIAVKHPDFCNYLLQREPKFLLDADVLELDEPTRRHAVITLLNQMDREETFDTWQDETFAESLNPSLLACQLRPYIVDENRNIVVRRTAIRLAGAARCTALKPDLWSLLEAPQQISIRRSAIQALGIMATSTDKPQFLRALNGDLSADSENELRGELLEFLVPRYLPVRSVLRYLVPRNDYFIGTYWRVTDHHLPDSVRLDDVLSVFRECKRRGNTRVYPSPLQKLVDASVKKSLQHFNIPRIRRACISFLAMQAELGGWKGIWSAVRPDGLTTKREVQLRRMIIEGFVELSKGDFVIFTQFGMWPEMEDLGWFLQRAQRARGANRIIWIEFVDRLTWRHIPRQLRPQFTRAYRNVPLLREKLPQPRRYSLFETLERRAKSVERRQEMWKRRRERRELEESKSQLTTAKILNYFREGRWQWWPSFKDILSRVEVTDAQSAGSSKVRRCDISTWHGWSQLPLSDRRMVRRVAVEFLQKATAPERKAGILYVYDEAAVCAIVLLGKAVAVNKTLRLTLRHKWIPAVLRGIYDQERELDVATALAYRVDRKQCLAWVREELLIREASDRGYTFLRRFKRCWDDALTTLVADFAWVSHNPLTVMSAHILLKKVAPKAALALWRKLTESRYTERRGECKPMVIFLGLFAFSEFGWTQGIAWLRDSARDGQLRFFREYAHLLDYEFRDWSSALVEWQLADLYLFLSDLFPPETLGDYSRGGSMGSVDYIADVQRACINILVQRGSAAGCAELRRISETVPVSERLWVRWRLREALDQRLRIEWNRDHPLPGDVLRMVRTASAVRVRDAGELQDAIVASLARLQGSMHVGEYPEILSFWREPGRVPEEEREVSRALSQWFHNDLHGDAGIVTDREPQVGWKGQFDLKVEIPASAALRRPRIVVIIEVKRCLHPDVKTACATQLAEGYLKQKGFTTGIYLVAWFDIPSSKVKWPTLDIAEDEVKGWATSASTHPVNIRGVALDCRWRNMGAPSGLAEKRAKTNASASPRRRR